MTRTIDDALLDEAWLAAPAQRSRGRMVLVGLLAASVCFLGGALVQQHFGTAATGTALPAGLPDFSGGLPSGFPAGGPASTDQQGEGAGSGASDATGSVIGIVVEIRDGEWVVEDLGGNRHTITFGEDTSIVREESLTTDQIKTGDRVAITGTTSNDQLQADDVTLR
jgi:hypothetical protein